MSSFTFKENDEELCIIDLGLMSGAMIDKDDYTIQVNFMNAPTLIQDFHTIDQCQHEFLRLTTAFQQEIIDRDSFGGIFAIDNNNGTLND